MHGAQGHNNNDKIAKKYVKHAMLMRPTPKCLSIANSVMHGCLATQFSEYDNSIYVPIHVTIQCALECLGNFHPQIHRICVADEFSWI